MKISEVIATLQQRMEEFGDVDVRIWEANWSSWDDDILISSDPYLKTGHSPFIGVN